MNGRITLGRTAPLAALALIGAAALAGCGAPGGASDATGSPEAGTASAAPTTSSSASPTASVPPEPVDVPEIAEGEIARVLLDATPADGVTTGGHTVSDQVVADVPVILEGACIGDSVGYSVVTADGEQRVLREGVFTCDAPASLGGAFSVAYTGPVQLILSRTDADSAWLRLVPA